MKFDVLTLGKCHCCNQDANDQHWDFDEIVMNSEDVWIVVFYNAYDRENSEKFISEFYKHSKELEGKVKCAKYEREGTLLSRFKVKNTLSVRIMKAGLKNKKTKLAVKYDVKGDGKDMDNITQLVNGMVKKKKNTKKTEDL